MVRIIRRNVTRRRAENTLHIAKYGLSIMIAAGCQGMASRYALAERGYKAIGGEVLVFPLVLYGSIKALDYGFNRLLDKVYPQRLRRA